MSTITVLRSIFETTDWKREFADSVLALCPDMNPDAADEVSDSEVLLSKDTPPKVAARRWVDSRLQTGFGDLGPSAGSNAA